MARLAEPLWKSRLCVHECLVVPFPVRIAVRVSEDEYSLHVVREDMMGHACVPESMDHADEKAFLLGAREEFGIPSPQWWQTMAEDAAATMAVREYNYQVPYGVIDFDEEQRIAAIREKPSYSFFVNAGIYVLSPEAVACVNKEEFFDMPQLFNVLVEGGKKTTVYPVREYWMDIGRMDDFERAQEEYGEMFTEGKDS